MQRVIFLGILGLGMVFILTGFQAIANDESIVSQPHSGGFHALSEILIAGNMAPISMTDEQLNAVVGKLTVSGGSLRQEISLSTQDIVNQQLAQSHQLHGESLRQEVSFSTHEILNKNFQ